MAAAATAPATPREPEAPESKTERPRGRRVGCCLEGEARRWGNGSRRATAAAGGEDWGGGEAEGPPMLMTPRPRGASCGGSSGVVWAMMDGFWCVCV